MLARALQVLFSLYPDDTSIKSTQIDVAINSLPNTTKDKPTFAPHSRRNSLLNNEQETLLLKPALYEEEDDELKTLSKEQLIKHIKTQEKNLYAEELHHAQTKRQLKDLEGHIQHTLQYLIVFEKSQEDIRKLSEEKSQLHQSATMANEELIRTRETNRALEEKNTTLTIANITARKEIIAAQKTVKKRDWIKLTCAFLIVIGLGLCCTGIGAAIGTPILAAATAALSIVGTGVGAGGAGALVIGCTAVLLYRHKKQSSMIATALANAKNQLPSENITPSFHAQANTLNQVMRQETVPDQNTESLATKVNSSNALYPTRCASQHFWRSSTVTTNTNHPQINHSNVISVR